MPRKTIKIINESIEKDPESPKELEDVSLGDSQVAEPQVAEPKVVKEKKPRTEKQILAFAKALEKRKANSDAKKALKDTAVDIPKEVDVELDEAEEDIEESIQRMREMAGIREAKKEVDEADVEEGNKFTAGLADDDIKVGEKIPGTNAVKKKDIDEGILASTRALWKKYQD